MTTELHTAQFSFSERTIRVNTADLTDRESCLQPSPGGNCVNWIVGHILANRNVVLRLLGEEPIWTKEEAAPYERGSQPLVDPETAIPLKRMLKDLEASHARIIGGLQRLGAEGLAEQAPPEAAGGKEASLGAVLSIFLFHEAYHVGQTGIMRRLIGKEGAIR
jgi:uncharacterized damage-inducible protein DinB